MLSLAVFAGCSGGSGSVPVPPAASSPSAVATTPSFAVPAKPSFAVPRRPSFATPAKPSTAGRPPVASTPHAGFFAGEAPLSNGVYYLQLPNGNPFGYYSYLPDPNYIYHFDLGYEYAIDANDGQGGVYLYDFDSGHWWYTSRSFTFPYVYDFTLNALLYYYPDTAQAGTYTKNPRWFYDFGTSSIIALPDYRVKLDFPSVQLWKAYSYTSGNGQCTNGPSTFCIGTNDQVGIGYVTGELPHQVGGHTGPWGLTSTNPAVSQAFNCADDGFANSHPCGYPGTGISLWGFAPGSSTITVQGTHNASAPIAVQVSETTIVVHLVNLTSAANMMITANYDNDYGNVPQQFIEFKRTLGASETYSVMNFPVGASTNLIRVDVGNGVSTIATATVTGVSIDRTHANTIELTPR
ncbi:MAG: hypothetical protein JWM87_2135 [Candidatus Eremiobacteraeota bacterium]|nr:hypothetical protein [Candidatus Eremiobacteraeota bacterium]